MSNYYNGMMRTVLKAELWAVDSRSEFRFFQWLHSSVGRAPHQYCEVMGSNPVEVLNFFQASLRNCINCIHCDDRFFIFNFGIVMINRRISLQLSRVLELIKFWPWTFTTHTSKGLLNLSRNSSISAPSHSTSSSLVPSILMNLQE